MVEILRNSFVHIRGINHENERKIWQNNILNWDEFIEKKHKLPSKFHSKAKYVKQSIEEYNNKNFKFFSQNLKNKDSWRLYKDMKHKTCFLDIETTGLSKHRNRITLIGLHSNEGSKIFINGKNLHEFENYMKQFDLIVSFNGKCFDVPFIKAKFPKLKLEQPHLDLRFILRSLGYSGGLKFIEKQIGINRDDDLQDISGSEAVRLWHKYERGNKEALDLLVKYNIADIENLRTLMDFSYDKLKEKEFHSWVF